MLTTAKMGGGRIRYYTSLAAEDYYLPGELSLEQPGVWYGKGAERLGLANKRVEVEAFRNLFHGFSPDGTDKLVRNAGRYDSDKPAQNRMPGYDFTCGAPKSFSLLWSVANPEDRKLLEQAHLKAVKATLDEIEKLSVIRTGKGGKIAEPCGLVVGIFQHGTARQVDRVTLPDVHLHSHLTCMNTGITEEGKSGALNGLDYLNKTFAKEFGVVYRTKLEAQAHKLGLETEKTEHGWEVKGVSQEAIRESSKRSRQIEKAAPRDQNSIKEQKRESLRLRVAKGDLDPKAIQEHWRREGEKHQITAETVKALFARNERLVKTSEHTEEKERKAEVRAEESYLKTVSLETKKAEVIQLRKAAEQEPKQKAENNEEKFRAHKREIERADAQQIKERPQAFARKASDANSGTFYERQEKRIAAREAREKERIETLKYVQDELQGKGHRVLGVSLSQKRTEMLSQAGIKATTASKLLYEATYKKKGPSLGRQLYANYKHATWQWSGKTKKKYLGTYHKPQSRLMHEFKYITWQISHRQKELLNLQLERKVQGKEWKITKKTVVLINEKEANRDVETVQDLQKAVEKKGGRVIFFDAYELHRSHVGQEQAKKNLLESVNVAVKTATEAVQQFGGRASQIITQQHSEPEVRRQSW